MSRSITRADSLDAIMLRIKQLQQDIVCQFCHEMYNDPRILESCLHVYCKDCVSLMKVRGNAYLYKCPQCKEQQEISDVDSLPIYNSVVETKKRDIRLLKQMSSEKEPHCSICAKVAAEFVCQDCADDKRLLCSKCSSPHNKDRTYADHRLDLLSSVYTQASRTTKRKDKGAAKWRQWNRTTSIVLSVCHQHGFQLRYFCQTCNESACYTCCEQLHDNHRVFLAEGSVDNARKLMASDIALIDRIQQELILATKPIEERKQRITEKEDHLELEIKSRFSRIKKAIDQQERQMQVQLRSVSEEKRENLSRQASQITELADKAMRLKSHMTDVVESTDDRALLNLTDLLLHKSSEFQSEYNRAVQSALATNPLQQLHGSQSADTFPSLVACEQANLDVHIPTNRVNHLLREVSIIYQVTADPSKCIAKGPGLQCATALEMSYFQVILVDAYGKQCTQPQQVSVNIHFNTAASCFPEKSTVVQKSNSTHLVTFCPRRAGLCMIQVLVNEENIKGSPFQVNVLHPNPLSPLSKLFSAIDGNDQAGMPRRVTLDHKGNLYVCVDHVSSSVIVFDQHAQQLSRFEEGMREVSGIAVGGDGSFYITSSYSHSLSKYDPKGLLVKLVGKRGKGNGEFDNPNGIAINSDGEVCVCDSINCRVQVFDSNLRYQRQFCTDLTAEGLRHPSQPFSISFNQMGMIFITDPCNHSILMYSHNEQFYKSFGKEGSRLGELRVPKCIAIDSEGYIYVSDSGNNRVAVFHSSNGDPVTNLGCTGMGEGYLNSPSGIAVDDNGHIFICDTLNEHIQVFRDDVVKMLY